MHEQRFQPETCPVGGIRASDQDLRWQSIEMVVDPLGNVGVGEELAERRVGVDLLDPLVDLVADDVDLLAQLDRAEREQPGDRRQRCEDDDEDRRPPRQVPAERLDRRPQHDGDHHRQQHELEHVLAALDDEQGSQPQHDPPDRLGDEPGLDHNHRRPRGGSVADPAAGVHEAGSSTRGQRLGWTLNRKGRRSL